MPVGLRAGGVVRVRRRAPRSSTVDELLVELGRRVAELRVGRVAALPADGEPLDVEAVDRWGARGGRVDEVLGRLRQVGADVPAGLLGEEYWRWRTFPNDPVAASAPAVPPLRR